MAIQSTYPIKLLTVECHAGMLLIKKNVGNLYDIFFWTNEFSGADTEKVQEAEKLICGTLLSSERWIDE